MATVVGPSLQPTPNSFQPQTHPFTCVTCAIAFRSSELQRTHMRSDWHRYNLKRRVASLPPLSSEVFAEKVLSAQASSNAAAAKASFEKACTACEKTYYSENAFRNHLGSQRHRMKLAVRHDGGNNSSDAGDESSVMSSTISLGELLEDEVPEHVDDPTVAAEFSQVVEGMKKATLAPESPVSKRPSRPHHSVDPVGPDGIRTDTPSVADTLTSTAMPINRCLFCNYDSDTMEDSVAHMSRIHGLFIPESAYLEDLAGLITYLQEKVTGNGECIYCHKLKGTVVGVQTHMRDKGHCMIAFDTEEEMLEVGQFYDFRSTYSDEDDEDDEGNKGDDAEDGKVSGSSKLGAKRSPFTEDGEDEEWESDLGEDSDVDSDGTEGPEATSKNHKASSRPTYHMDSELHLPSGRTAGHRSLQRYYRQNLRQYPVTADERERQQQRLLTQAAHNSNVGEVMGGEVGNTGGRQVVTRGTRGLGMIGVSDEAKRALLKKENKEQRQVERSKRGYEWKVQRQANNQKHFRDEMLQ